MDARTSGKGAGGGRNWACSTEFTRARSFSFRRSFVIRPDRTVTYAHYGKAAGDVPEIGELAELLAEEHKEG